MTPKIKLSKDQIQKLALSSIGLIVLVYVYLNFFLGPLNKSRASMEATIADLQQKLGSSKGEMARADSLQREAGTATTRYAALQALAPEGAPIAWFPPRMKAFFANQQIDKAGARLGNSTALKEPELEAWSNYSWLIDLPQADFSTLGNAIAQLENAEPLLSINKINIRILPDQPQFQQVELTAYTVMQKK
ncbi:MAG: hypothetical protein ABI992_01270 [Chthoniobacterales bacterium]